MSAETSYRRVCESCSEPISATFPFCPWCQAEQEEITSTIDEIRDGIDDTPKATPDYDANPPSPTYDSIATQIISLLRSTPGVCAEGNVHGWRFIRYHHPTGEWQAVKCGGKHRTSGYVHGTVLDEDDVQAWLASKPATLLPVSEAYQWGPKEHTVWEHADRQDVFEDYNRCFYCGCSSRLNDLRMRDTVDHGETRLCEENCYGIWKRSGELAEAEA